MANLPPAVSLVELRLDALDPAAFRSGEWLTLPGDMRVDWVATWRSPEEGGAGGPCPTGVLPRALEAGYRWVDVEARRLDAGDAEAQAVPGDRRWVSAHPLQSPRSPADLRQAWESVSRHPAALQKLVIPADRFLLNTWILDLDRELGSERAGERSLFARGWIGHPSRVLGRLAGQGVMFLALGEGPPTADGQPSLDLALRTYGLGEADSSVSLYGILGSPARHSRSPEIHNEAFRRQGYKGIYIVLESEAAEPVIQWVREGQLAGASVTAPFKRAAAAGADALEDDARRIGAVNTLYRREGRVWGANTDFEAAKEIFDGLGLSSGDSAAVLGAGGAARAVLAALQDLGITATVYNRDPDRGRETAAAFRAEWGGGLDLLPGGRFPVVINTTPLGRSAALPVAVATAIRRDTAIVDLGYGSEPSALESLAESLGSSFCGGLEFLARQAVGAQERWTGVRPSWEQISKTLEGSGEGERR